MSSIKYWIWLAEALGPESDSFKLLIENFGSPEKIYYADPEEYKIPGYINDSTAKRLTKKSMKDVEKIIEDCEKLNLRILSYTDADYPENLRNLAAPPCVLYISGRLPYIDDEAAIAVVGTRRCTAYGRLNSEKLSFQMARRGMIIVSGLAKGIDTAAHEGALKAGRPTVAILGCGIDVVYPRENKHLYNEIARCGALVSEYPPGTRPNGSNFPQRNRIISGLAHGVLVVEAPRKSGALITAHMAIEQGKDVFVVPGNIDAPNSEGCNDLIYEGAQLIRKADDIIQEYMIRFSHKLSELPEVRKNKYSGAEENESITINAKDVSEDEKKILEAIGRKTVHIDDIIEMTQLPASKVSAVLTQLELRDYVEQRHGKKFKLTEIFVDK